MPTPVSAARQCLTTEAASALDEAVAVARRRGHSQTTSLHAISALLSIPSSPLRDACSRSRNSAYSHRLQFKALELCLSVSLDRVSSGHLADDPPVSNSLMAAIKRSQANQRRQPENFHLYHQMAAQCSSSTSSINHMIKVELRNLILSILDDPVVSRVFGEAGFRSTEIKLAIVRPLPHLFRYGGPRGRPPLFLADGPEFGLGGRRGLGFHFPFSVFQGFSDVDENCRRIGEFLVRNKGRNPLLVGLCATDALHTFVESVKSKKDGCLPSELSGLNTISLEDDLLKLVAEEKVDESRLDLLFSSARSCPGAGLLVNFGDLKGFVNDSVNNDVVGLVVTRFARLLETYRGKIWLIGATTSYDTYLKFLNKFPSAEKELDMQILPITTLRPSMAESCSRSSLTESFVPFAGFFSTSSELSIPVSGNSYQRVSPHDKHNEKGNQKTAHATEGSTTPSVADHYQCSLPSWLGMTKLGVKGVTAKNKDDGSSTTACLLQKEFPCTSQHSDQPGTNSNASPGAARFETVIGFQSAKENRQNEYNQSLSKNDSCLYETGCRSISSSTSMVSQKVMPSQHATEAPLVPKTKKESFLYKLMEKPSSVECVDPYVFRSPDSSGYSLSTDDGIQTSPASATSVTTSLGLGASHASEAVEFNIRGNETVCASPSGGNSIKEIIPRDLQSSSELSTDVNLMDFKMLYGDLMKKLGRQDEAVRSICEVLCRARSETRKTTSRGDLWFTFLGADMIGKRRIAVALSDILHKHLIYVDLCPQGGMRHDDVKFPRKVKSYDGKFRGKTTVDVIAGELGKNPCSIIFIENVEKADEQVQSNLSQAFWSGKFSDSYGREVSMRNAVVIATSNLVKVEGILSAAEGDGMYSEDRILGSECRKMKILVEGAILDAAVDNHNRILYEWKALWNKRKRNGSNGEVVLLETSGNVKRANKNLTRELDLNLPADSTETLVGDEDGGLADNDATFDDTMRWLSEFIDRMDATVSFKPYDLDSLANMILEEIQDSFRKSVGSEFLLEVDSKVIDQLVLTAYIYDSRKVWEDWLKQVLNREFTEIRRRFHLAERSIIKLLTCEEPLSEDPAFVGHLPSRIIIDLLSLEYLPTLL